MESRDIQLGAIPFVLLQLLLVAVVIFFPQSVTALLDKPPVVDLDKVEIPMTDKPKPGDDKPSMDGLFKDAGAPASAASR